ncbi:3-oxoacyl- synthase [Pseudomonas coronafaciens pv. oryzae]|uniref:beta-ketoacyl-[acyl-carrier-protein] synthase family protein n=1 Tax=Pseudomonas syringae group TaxID=136849 RepID=UPI0004096446|nr:MULTISPECIES: beta-ketoacyl-[acyl-carrier-protein] synthase family protein [Pseudomonas syringae group]KPB55173.1 3-oxoacyl-Acyl-carrier-protein synthase [Pseudomonas coronafaciens pv. oryzae]KPY06802.1 3-oxoacyl- synthase [Pseudomonas coronafaciens pv. oryzae]RMT06987.1 3-oxoacyl- synthase [Pseudomonas coronafaciens pv. oryzae]RMV69381.1 3-oxoacyl- synthase [Pseudomonas coronafaciens pv. atropurpurea]
MTAYLNALGVICSLGASREEVSRRLFAGDSSGMVVESGWVPERALPVGAVKAELPAMPPAMSSQHSRNNQLLLAAALQIEDDIRLAIERFGAARIGVIIGTSTSGIDEASSSMAIWLRDKAFPEHYDYRQQELGAPAGFLASWLQLTGPAYVISTACTSSARALLSARRALEMGLCDAVLCGGVDSLCKLTLNGFSALEAMSPQLCNPFSRHRNGINIGEAAALFLMTREAGSTHSVALLGAGASCDAHHISAPEPSGRGAQNAMLQALSNARLDAAQIGYLNLHGTATPLNDAMESRAVQAVFPEGVPCSSTKPLSGHTLGAAGALEAAFCWLSLAPHNSQQALPPHVWDGEADPQLPALQWTLPGTRLASADARYMMSNSFAFGGNNISLIIGDAP